MQTNNYHDSCKSMSKFQALRFVFFFTFCTKNEEFVFVSRNAPTHLLILTQNHYNNKLSKMGLPIWILLKKGLLFLLEQGLDFVDIFFNGGT